MLTSLHYFGWINRFLAVDCLYLYTYWCKRSIKKYLFTRILTLLVFSQVYRVSLLHTYIQTNNLTTCPWLKKQNTLWKTRFWNTFCFCFHIKQAKKHLYVTQFIGRKKLNFPVDFIIITQIVLFSIWCLIVLTENFILSIYPLRCVFMYMFHFFV